MSDRADNLVWIDLEMTGLDPETCRIIEIATIVTDGELQVIAEGPVLAIHQPDEILSAMDEWNTTHHGASGLTEQVRTSPIDTAEAERQTLAFLAEHCDRGSSPLCGSSVHHDRRFIAKYMPALHEFLHYRIVDVSSIKELVRRWYGPDYVPPKGESHRALEDIRESIRELAHYRATVFKPAEPRTS